MPLSIPAKDDLMQTVYIELERMFTVLHHRKTPDERVFYAEVETAIKSRLKRISDSLHDSSQSDEATQL